MNYSIVITRDYSLALVLEKLKKAKKQDDIIDARDLVFSPIELAYFLNDIITIDDEVVIDSQILREIVDTSYDTTQRL